mmetsp:Transcript_80442/g.134585  ORF Transcript_80442/g.134585 Transcript_80442/m.134585 type:complete len:128 (-) Transcript_80442:148-531(-)
MKTLHRPNRARSNVAKRLVASNEHPNTRGALGWAPLLGSTPLEMYNTNYPGGTRLGTATTQMTRNPRGDKVVKKGSWATDGTVKHQHHTSVAVEVIGHEKKAKTAGVQPEGGWVPYRPGGGGQNQQA